ncbi:1-phosphatidylinositol 4,5-bisphosphate phosphodiesterase delta-1-like isoform X1 [Labeo rohita]|uniref:Phosphoinositide phospholipase C n=1 Tax=Labeo rohita TaxID=84645 RepID=A0A498LKF5_LABRO|nr:1-phosphatidylinositol 4,5-bisphosphate phosphodiesterase delta-1-like isoform X1 [Labeo rohita]RXN08737.1 1-phosphatidylinositol 4,5-bisphosphate phosphodiesterase delta-1-like isoform X1 [Labeo rohita]RXN19314.1 1-phosphatidylinositol 4,5-bisphosphate phosphodiesterase delta-1-like isoform X1 [Labeo rohita]
MQCVRRQPARTKSQESLYRAQTKTTAKHNMKLIGLEGDKDLQFLMNGGDLLKVRSGSWKQARFYKLQEDCKTMWQESKKAFKSKQTFSVEDIDEVRTGRQTEALRKYTEDSVEGRAFSILFKGRQKGLDLIANSEEDAKKWVGGLEKVISNIKNLTPQEKTEQYPFQEPNFSWIYSCMRKADKNFDNKISQNELKSFLQDINIEVAEDYAEMLFQKCDKSKSGVLEGKEIEHFYEILTEREEIDVIYAEYAKTGGLMSVADLQNFLLNEQKENASQNDALQLIEKYELDENAKQQMTKDGFLMYLNQPEGLIFNLAHKSVYQDMNQPLNHYFISSSHNTYLLEDQLKGPSSIEAYIKALLKGCRCVELDCWDGSDGEPVIYHGYTLTSKVLFKDVIKAIKEYAFKTSEYPVILSVENHCSVEQQKTMAEHLISILGSALVTKPLGDQMPTCLPSPEQKSKSLKVAKELSDIVIYCKSVHFHGFEDSRDNQSFYEMASFKEGKAVTLAEESANDYIHHNTDKLSRIYPAGLRTDSSNYNPVPLWNAGCQIVALNFQTPCPEMDLNQGLFLQNGRSGYNLKPAFLRDRDTKFDPITLPEGPWLRRKTLHVMVISAQQLPKVSTRKSSIVDPIVKVQIYGVPADMTEVETQYIENNGFNPMWNENFKFDVRVPDLALVRFLIEDYDSSSSNEFIGQYTLPFNSLKNGYHHVPLLTQNGDHLSFAGLFVHIMVVDAE